MLGRGLRRGVLRRCGLMGWHLRRRRLERRHWLLRRCWRRLLGHRRCRLLHWLRRLLRGRWHRRLHLWRWLLRHVALAGDLRRVLRLRIRRLRSARGVVHTYHCNEPP